MFFTNPYGGIYCHWFYNYTLLHIQQINLVSNKIFVAWLPI